MFELQKKIIELNGKINLKERVINFNYQDNLIVEIITNKEKLIYKIKILLLIQLQLQT